jgi:signal transduction histidine kinase
MKNEESASKVSPWELAAETITVKIRWFGLVIGYALVNLGDTGEQQLILNAILTLGAIYTILDTWFSLYGRIFLGDYPLVISMMESIFIALLCFYDRGHDSAFRYYYFLSLICCAVRHQQIVTYLTCALHSASYWILYLLLPAGDKQTFDLALTLVMLGWVTWASNALAMLLKNVGEYLARLNAALQRQQAELELRVAERTAQLEQTRALVLQQEKMAAFGLLAAGIAHEVGNPLTSISNIVQMLQRHIEEDEYTQKKLDLVSGQLKRIQGILRELVEFSRPAKTTRTRATLAEILDESLNIAKYYKRTRGRIASPTMPPDLPTLFVVRDQLVQVFLNLILNAIDATMEHKHAMDRIETPDIMLEVKRVNQGVEISVHDNGPGVSAEASAKLFQAYNTTKAHGTGLGLFVTRRLVEDHGGTVSYESTPGKGTTFRVWLPIG